MRSSPKRSRRTGFSIDASRRGCYVCVIPIARSPTMTAGKKTPTVREMLDAKRAMIRKNQDDFKLKLQQAPRAVQDEYHRCRGEIDRLLKAPGRSLKRIEATLYPAKGKAATL